jgi:hypothetical protein
MNIYNTEYEEHSTREYIKYSIIILFGSMIWPIYIIYIGLCYKFKWPNIFADCFRDIDSKY